MSEEQLYKIGDVVDPKKKMARGGEVFFRVAHVGDFEKDGQKKFRYWVTPFLLPGIGYSWEQDEIEGKHNLGLQPYLKAGKRRKTRRRR